MKIQGTRFDIIVIKTQQRPNHTQRINIVQQQIETKQSVCGVFACVCISARVVHKVTADCHLK